MHLQADKQARDVLQRAIRAKGGADRLRSVRTVVATGTLTVRSPQPVEARTTAYIQYPDKFRVDAALPNGEVTQVYAAGEAWRSDPSGVHDLDAQEREALRNNASRDLVSLLLREFEGTHFLRASAKPSATQWLPFGGGVATSAGIVVVMIGRNMPTCSPM